MVEADNVTYVGNAFNPSSGFSSPGGQRDDRNNTEAVFLGPQAPSAVQITVEASNIVADGIPAYGDGTDQDFALVCWNCEADPFTLEINPPWQEGCSPGTLSAEVVVNETGSGSEPVQLQVIGPSELNFMIEDGVVTPPATTTIHMTLPLGMSGTFDYSVQAISDDFMQTVEATVVVENAVSLAPVLQLPEDGEQDVSTLPTLVWRTRRVRRASPLKSPRQPISRPLLHRKRIDDESYVDPIPWLRSDVLLACAIDQIPVGPVHGPRRPSSPLRKGSSFSLSTMMTTCRTSARSIPIPWTKSV